MTILALSEPRPRAGHGPHLDVDLDAVAFNTQVLNRKAGGALMAVVKADGFGHGAVDVARTALGNGASWLGVTSIDEAIALRRAGLRAPTLSWLNGPDADFGAAIAGEIDLAVPSREHLEAVMAAGLGARVHLHLDTGMARDGAAPEDWAKLCAAARRAEQQGRVRVVGMMGHLACADEPAHPDNATGRTRFAWGLEVARRSGLRPPLRHLATTSATLTDPLSHHTLSRVGCGLVGIDPTRTTLLRPAMKLTAPVVGVRTVRAGTSVGYGAAWTASRRTHLALLPLGYADGLPRASAGRAEVQIGGRRCPVVGRISMDQVVVDVGDREPELGETAVVFGPGDAGEPTVAEWATWADTIEHEIVTGIGARVTR